MIRCTNFILICLILVFAGCTAITYCDGKYVEGFSLLRDIDVDEIDIENGTAKKYHGQTDMSPELLAVIESLVAAEGETEPLMAGSGYITPSAKEAVAKRANRRCEICFTDLYPGGCFIGEYAHIKGERPGSARHDPNLIDTQAADNLLLACPNCHTQIDKCPEQWPVELLNFCKDRSQRWSP